MATKLKSTLHLQTAHVLFVDVVGYSKLPVNKQREVVHELNQIVRETPQFRKSDADGELISIPTGDGMALVFFRTPEEPVHCAMEIAESLKTRPHLGLRMGIHSGPVDGVTDVNDRPNVAGVAINLAERLMSLGEAGHILMTRRVAADLLEDPEWQAHLHDLGEVELKHGVKVGVVNFYTADVGNSKRPEKIRAALPKTGLAAAFEAIGRSPRARYAAIAVSALIVLLAVWAINSFRGRSLLTNVPANGTKSIAVLPFENLSADPDNAFFADGVQDEILTDLAKIADLKVISRTSVMQYRDTATRNLRGIAQQLGVARVLEGSVQRVANKIRVNAQLIDARNDVHLWARTYDRDLADVFAVQSEIAQEIADQLQAKISPSERADIASPPTTDLTAFHFYVQAQALWADASDPVHGKEKLPEAARVLTAAVTRDPNFFLAWCLLAKTHGALYKQGYDRTPARADLAHAAVGKAMQLRPDAGAAHLALATYYYYVLGDFGKARQELQIARTTLPNDPEVFLYSGFINRREGHWDQAAKDLEEALDLDPRSLFLLQQVALTYAPLRRYSEEAQTWDRVLAIIPGDPLTRITRALVAFHERADLNPFRTTLEAVLKENPIVSSNVDPLYVVICERNPRSSERSLGHLPLDGEQDTGVLVPHGYWEGVIAQQAGDLAKARSAFAAARDELAKAVDQQPNFAGNISWLGVIDAGLGRKEDAVREGKRACELTPISRDAIDGGAYAVNLAHIYAWIGEKDLAIQQIEAIERVPNKLSYGVLKLTPYWDSLRGDPRFEKIVGSLAPKH